jgi:sugar lactone lactonase YvrE
MVIDSRGYLLFAEKNHNRIRSLSPDGIIGTVAGTSTLGNEGDGGPALAATLYMPSEMAIDQADNLYFVSRQGNGWVVRRIDQQGVIHRFAGNGLQGREGDDGPALDASFYAITDIAVDAGGAVYISDLINRNIRRVGPDGIIREVAGAREFSSLGEEVHINGLAVDGNGTIFFSDSGSSKVRKIDTAGNIATVGGSGEFADSGDGGPAIAAGIRSPGGLALSPKGELYIAEAGTSRIRKIDPAGIITTVAGTGEPGFSGDGGPANQAMIKSPQRMVFDHEGNLYFTDRDNNRIRRIDAAGIITTVAGHGNFGWMQDGLEVRIMIQDFP